MLFKIKKFITLLGAVPYRVCSCTGQASKTILANKSYCLALIALIPLIFFLLVAIPVNTIPSNDFKTQLSLYKASDYIMLTALSFFISLFFLMHAYNFARARKAKERARLLGVGSVGSSAGVLASVFGAATCPMCVASLFSFLGFGTVGFLLNYQWWVFVAAFIPMLASLYFVSRKVNSVCAKCI